MELKATSSSKRVPQGSLKSANPSHGVLFQEDVVTFPDEVLLLVQTQKDAYLPRKEDYECVFAGPNRRMMMMIGFSSSSSSHIMSRSSSSTPIHAIGFKEPQLMYVRCPAPSNSDINWTQSYMTVTLQAVHQQLGSDQGVIQNVAQVPTKPTWETLVYEAVVQVDSVVLFAKGLPQSRLPNAKNVKDLASLRCVFGNMEVMTWVVLVAQEVLRSATNSISSFLCVVLLRFSSKLWWCLFLPTRRIRGNRYTWISGLSRWKLWALIWGIWGGPTSSSVQN